MVFANRKHNNSNKKYRTFHTRDIKCTVYIKQKITNNLGQLYINDNLYV